MTEEKIERRVLIASGSDKVYDYMEEILPAREFHPVTRANNAGEARRLLVSMDFDIVIINAPLPDDFGIDLALDFADSTMAILLLVKNDLFEQVAYKVEDSGILTVAKPNTRQAIYSAIKLLSALSARLGMMEKKNRSLQDKMTDIRIVNRAKWLLIEHLNMNEKDAHHYVEKQAMDGRISRREVAERIIRTYDK